MLSADQRRVLAAFCAGRLTAGELMGALRLAAQAAPAGAARADRAAGASAPVAAGTRAPVLELARPAPPWAS